MPLFIFVIILIKTLNVYYETFKDWTVLDQKWPQICYCSSAQEIESISPCFESGRVFLLALMDRIQKK